MQTLKLQFAISSEVTDDTAVSQIHRLSGECIAEVNKHSHRTQEYSASYLEKLENDDSFISETATSPRVMKLIIFEGVGKLQQSFRKLARSVCKTHPSALQIGPKIEALNRLLHNYEQPFQVAMHSMITDVKRVSQTIEDGINLIKNLTKIHSKFSKPQDFSHLVEELRSLLSNYASSKKSTLRSMCSLSSVEEESKAAPEHENASIPEQAEEGTADGVSPTAKNSTSSQLKPTSLEIAGMVGMKHFGIGSKKSLGYIEEMASQAELSAADKSMQILSSHKIPYNRTVSGISEDISNLDLGAALEGNRPKLTSLNSKDSLGADHSNQGTSLSKILFSQPVDKNTEHISMLEKMIDMTQISRVETPNHIKPPLIKLEGILNEEGAEGQLKNKLVYVVDKHPTFLQIEPKVVSQEQKGFQADHQLRTEPGNQSWEEKCKLIKPSEELMVPVRTKKLSLGLVKGVKNSLSSCSNDTKSLGIDDSRVTPNFEEHSPHLSQYTAQKGQNIRLAVLTPQGTIVGELTKSQTEMVQNILCVSNVRLLSVATEQSSPKENQALRTSNATDSKVENNNISVLVNELAANQKSMEKRYDLLIESLTNKVQNLEFENVRLRKTLYKKPSSECNSPKHLNFGSSGADKNIYLSDSLFFNNKEKISYVQAKKPTVEKQLAPKPSTRGSGQLLHRASPSVADDLLLTSKSMIRDKTEQQVKDDHSKRSSIGQSEALTTSMMKSGNTPKRTVRELLKYSPGISKSKLTIPQFLKPFFKSKNSPRSKMDPQLEYTSGESTRGMLQSSSLRKMTSPLKPNNLSQPIDVILTKSRYSQFHQSQQGTLRTKPQPSLDYHSLMKSSILLSQDSNLFKECCLKRGGVFYKSKSLTIHLMEDTVLSQIKESGSSITFDLLMASVSGFGIESVSVLNYGSFCFDSRAF